MPTDHVAILLGTRNGAAFLGDQIQSYLAQTHRDWSLHVSDDNSTDTTLDVISSYAEVDSAHLVSVRSGPDQGFCRNFMALARDPTIEGDFFAFSDQDDIWYPDKLERALRCLSSIPRSTPAMYCSRTELVDTKRSHLGFSPLFSRAPSFQNALIQNIGGGNTMVFNAAAKRLLEKVNAEVVSHDWWTYQIVSVVGGAVIYDPRPSLEYRQHERNIMGSNATIHARFVRLQAMLRGQFKEWNDKNVSALVELRPHIGSQNLATLESFIAARNAR